MPNWTGCGRVLGSDVATHQTSPHGLGAKFAAEQLLFSVTLELLGRDHGRVEAVLRTDSAVVKVMVNTVFQDDAVRIDVWMAEFDVSDQVGSSHLLITRLIRTQFQPFLLPLVFAIDEVGLEAAVPPAAAVDRGANSLDIDDVSGQLVMNGLGWLFIKEIIHHLLSPR